MENIQNKFSNYDSDGQALIEKAYLFATSVLKEDTRYNGKPFIEHPLNIASIVSNEIGLPAECIAAFFLHESIRKHPDIDIKKRRLPN